MELATAPWHFASMPGVKSKQWPQGLPNFVEALDELDQLAFWQEPLDVLEEGRVFVADARAFILN